MSSAGVWVVGSYDWNFIICSIHASLEDAAVACESYEEIRFVLYGSDPQTDRLTAAQAKEKGYL